MKEIERIIKEDSYLTIFLGIAIAMFALFALIDFPEATVFPLGLLMLYIPVAFVHILNEKDYEKMKSEQNALQGN